MDRAYSLTSNPLANPLQLAFHQLTQYGRNLALAGLITLLLILVMSRLIATDFTEPAMEEYLPIKEVVLPDLKPTVEDSSPPERPLDPPPQPVTPSVETVVKPTETTIIVAPPAPGNDGGKTISINRDPIPIFKAAPRYPSAAIRRGIEGYVVVEFTITRTGAVRDARAIAGYDSAGNPTDVFNRSAVSAAARFKYQPQMDEGEPVERYGVRNRITYKLAD